MAGRSIICTGRRIRTASRRLPAEQRSNAGWVAGNLLFCLLLANTRFWAVQVYLSILLKLLTPARTRLRVHVSALIAGLARRWAMTFQDSFVYQDAGDEDGGRDARLDGQLDRFLQQWLINLKKQGHSLSPE